MGPVASFHLITERSWRQPLVLARLVGDRRALADVDGVLFARTLGTGRGSNTGPSVDARRSAVFLVWRDGAAVESFLADHPLPGRWRSSAEHWTVLLRPVATTGTWAGCSLPGPVGEVAPVDGPVAVLTRASIRPGATLPFLRASRATAIGGRTGREVAGLRAIVGIGERPVGRLGTFSVWSDRVAATAFAHDDSEHAAVVQLARRRRWFSEELFATFSPIRTEGSWAGVDPFGQST